MPSGFTKSQYKIENKDWTPSYQKDRSVWEFLSEIMSLLDEGSLELIWIIFEWFDNY